MAIFVDKVRSPYKKKKKLDFRCVTVHIISRIDTDVNAIKLKIRIRKP